MSKNSTKKYIYELAEKGFLRIVGKSGRANVYDLAKSEKNSINYDLKNIPHDVFESITYELGEWAVDAMKKDEFIEKLDVMNFDSGVDKPKWLD